MEQAVSRTIPPPWWVVLLALGAGGLFVFATTYGGHVLNSARAGRTPAPQTPAPEAAPLVIPGTPTLPDWRVALAGSTCALPCARGAACAVNPTKCSSGLTCIPGTGREPFAPEETWMIHLSAVQETGPDGKALDPCRTRRDFWVCRAGTAACASQRDACSHGAKSTVGIPVTGDDIAKRAIVLEVHEGDPTAPPIASTLPLENLVRGGLCNGFGRDAVGGGIGRVTYFLLPP